MKDRNPADIEALFDPPPDRVIETHISRVFLSGDRAWKLKKAVTLPYVDLGRLEQRRIACGREVRLNRRTAPDLYLGCRPVYDSGGRLTFAETGRPVEWLVEMKRFPADATFDLLAKQGALAPELIRHLADDIAAFHATTEIVPVDAVAAMRHVADLNRAAFAGLPPDALPADRLRDLLATIDAECDRQQAVLAGRQAAGRMRHGHGDLHLRNIALIDGRPVLFDCLEFDDGLAQVDTLYDFAFLLMDLLEHGRRGLANLALNRYLEAGGDYAGLPLLPLYVAQRAAIRCHIAALQPQGRAEARRYLDLAIAALHPSGGRLLAVGGFSGTGKTTLAQALAPDLGGHPWGGVVLRTDVLRKQRLNAPLNRPLPRDSYTPQASRAIYAQMLELAAQTVSGNGAVVLDAVFGKSAERREAEAVAEGCGTSVTGLWLTAPLDTLVERIASRRNDASDASEDVVRWQHQNLQPPEPAEAHWTVVDTGAGRDAALAAARAALAGPDPASGIRPPGLLSKASRNLETDVLSRLSRLIRPRTAGGRIATSLVAGLGLPVLLYAILMLRTHGYEPMGLCHPVPAAQGHLPIDMSRGSGIPTTCGLDWGFVGTSILLPGLGFAFVAYLLLTLLARIER
ncbi:MAG: AAA family ATPase [Ferrovibrio sp.]